MDKINLLVDFNEKLYEMKQNVGGQNKQQYKRYDNRDGQNRNKNNQNRDRNRHHKGPHHGNRQHNKRPHNRNHQQNEN